MTKINAWLNKPLNLKVFFGLVISIAVACLGRFIFCDIYDNDMYFIIATGREIMENGIITTNVWSIYPDLKLVAQQWLYAVCLAFFDQFGTIGIVSFFVIEFSILCVVLMHFFSLKLGKGHVMLKLLLMAFVIVFSQRYLFCVRPELLTMILLLVDCIALEHFMRSNNKMWLSLLPIMMLIEINIHASMWVMHFAVILAYVVPIKFLPGVSTNELYKKWKSLLVMILFMIGAMFVNPYGVDAILYVIKSFVADTFSYVNIIEVKQPIFISETGVLVVVLVSALIANYKTKVLNTITLNMTLGILAMMLFASRNMMFVILPITLLFANLGEYLISENHVMKDWKKDVDNSILLLLVPTLCIFCLDTISAIQPFVTSHVNLRNMNQNLYSIHQYLDDVVTDDSRIFTGFNCGAYFEYMGYHNLYMDARPEVYTLELNGKYDVLADYSKYCLKGVSLDSDGESVSYATKADIDAWFDDCAFDYVVVSLTSETYFAAYMALRDDYKDSGIAVKNNVQEYILYEKV
ncbi:hypothetical protein J6A31_04775 [bacterium]|nr:hypothetical protein [bacterium]